MADVFGIVASAVSTAAVFATYVDCFDHIQLGRHFGRDFQTSLLQLNCARLRLARWGKAVDIYQEAQFEQLDETLSECQIIKETLLQILALFGDAAKVSAKYEVGTKDSTKRLSAHRNTEWIRCMRASLVP